jgi:copper chaperone CopZ
VLTQVDGVKEAKADYQRDWAWAKYDPAKVTPEKLVEAINKNTNFKASLPEKQKDKPPQR